MRDLRVGQWIRAMVIGGDDGINTFVRTHVTKRCVVNFLCGELLLLTLPCDALCPYLFVGGHWGRTRYRSWTHSSGHQGENLSRMTPNSPSRRASVFQAPPRDSREGCFSLIAVRVGPDIGSGLTRWPSR